MSSFCPSEKCLMSTFLLSYFLYFSLSTLAVAANAVPSMLSCFRFGCSDNNPPAEGIITLQRQE